MSESEVAGIGGGAAGGYPALMAHAYQSASDAEAGDFKSIYASAITLALSELPFTPLFENFVSVVEYDGDRVVASYDLTREDLDWDWTPGADTTTGVLTVDTAVFDAASTFVVTMRGPDPEVIDVMTDFGGPYTHQSQRDFDAIWKAVTTLDVGTVSAMAMVPDKDDFRAVAEIAAGGKLRRVYTRISHGFTWAPAGGGDEGVLTIVGADLLAGSTFIVFVAGPELGTARADAATTIATRVKRVQPIGADGKVISGGGGTSVGGGSWSVADGDFTAVYAGADSLTLGVFPAAMGTPGSGDFVEVIVTDSTGLQTRYVPTSNTMNLVGQVLTVDGAVFTTGGSADISYDVVIKAVPKSYDGATNSDQVYPLTIPRPPQDSSQKIATGLGDGTEHEYFDVEQGHLITIRILDTPGVAGDNTYTLWSSQLNDTTPEGSADYQDVTDEETGQATVTSADIAAKPSIGVWAIKDFQAKRYRVTQVRANDAVNTDGAYQYDAMWS